jgi:hypothetical protein
MLTRYNALLEHLEGRYDAVIIVAHSQGSVLSADLLRWRMLTRRNQVPIYLLTMGSPLRQLYASRFPDLYGWITRSSAEDLGVKAWVNVFRSGDYVGRAIWTPYDDPHVWDYKPPRLEDLEKTTQRADFCLGEGSHTHYWCQHAPEVGVVLDALIREAIAKAAIPPRAQPPEAP